ncbi:MAG: CDC48 family AAA ATPase [Bacillota bacterium]|nr:CDC48 family AAA ATPase [Bacillota bacterium]
MFFEEGVELRVAEALPRDVGRGIARIDPADISRLGCEIGDVVEIRGKRSTPARVMPAFPEHRGRRAVQIDGIVRKNAQVALDDRVTLVKAHWRNAEKLTLVPVYRTHRPDGHGDTLFIRKAMEGIAVSSQDHVRVNLFGSLPYEFEVAETVPKGIVVVTAATRMVLTADQVRRGTEAKVTYEDIGGLSKEIQRIREMIELPLRHPELFERLGIEAPKGVLLCGPPGTGKTLIARAIASEAEAFFVHVNGPEIIHKYYGESEAQLRKVFEEAKRNAPSIIFLDEVDAIAPKRKEVAGEVEKRVVAQLLALLDGLERRGQVIVIAATNIPDALDPALRRPGRLDREITISVPDRAGRLEILQIHTRGMPLAKDIDLDGLARVTHGFVGADLEALCKEAGMSALRRLMPEIDLHLDHIPDDALARLEVTMDDFLGAFREIQPSGTREVFVEVPEVRWSDIGGLEAAKQDLIQAVEWPLKYPALFEMVGIGPPKGILLYGPPGCGKTMLAKAIATESEANFISIKGPELLSKWVGESERGVREIFSKARRVAPCIVFFDEIDAIAPARTASSDSAVMDRVVSQLLTEIDGIEQLRGILVIGATNRIDMVDPAILRPGRLELHIELSPPDLGERVAIFRVHMAGKPIAEDVTSEWLASLTPGATGADIEALCRRAGMLAIRDFLQSLGVGETSNLPRSRCVIRAEHFREAIASATRKA